MVLSITTAPRYDGRTLDNGKGMKYKFSLLRAWNENVNTNMRMGIMNVKLNLARLYFFKDENI